MTGELRKLYHVPKLEASLISVSTAADEGNDVNFSYDQVYRERGGSNC